MDDISYLLEAVHDPSDFAQPGKLTHNHFCHTQRGLYRYKRLMFGVTSAPGKYPQVIHDVLRGCKGVANIADNLAVHGKGIEEHDRRLFAVLGRLSEVGCRTRIAADASPVGLGAVLTQQQGGVWRVISYVSRSLTDVERRYSQAEGAYHLHHPSGWKL